MGIFLLAFWILPNSLVLLAGVVIVGIYIYRKKDISRYVKIGGLILLMTIISVIALSSLENNSLIENTIKVENNKPSPITKPASTSGAIIQEKTSQSPLAVAPIIPSSQKLYSVVKVVDGDTVDVSIDGKTERLRLIGINTPETVDPRKPVECFGVEASNKAKSILTGKKVALEADITQGERDKYDRLLRYVFLENGTNFNLQMIKDGFAYEYTYDIPYKYQIEFKKAQKEAMEAKAGLWGDMCNGSSVLISATTTQTNTNTNGCTIKGNISSTKEKIFHVIGCGSYAKTTIDESQGERWFCTEQEALDAGWRKALNCN